MAFLPFVVVFFLFSVLNSAFAKSEKDSADSSAIVNYYNPAGSFVYQPEPGIHPNENEMKAGLLFDLVNNKIVWQKAMNTPYPIASLTKMMVALITVEDIRVGKINWTDNVSWNRNLVIGKGKKKRFVSEKVNYSLLDVFKSAMIASNNEASEQMAKYVGGDVQSFVDRMNMRARELSMNSTYFGNPTGLPATAKTFDNSSTPTDLLLLTLEMLKYDEILQVTGMGYADINNGKRNSIIRNHNRLTIDYKGEVDGMKTGYTRRAGFCLVATSNKCDQRLISVVLGARSPNLRNEVVKTMINDYYSAIGLDKLGPYCAAPSRGNETIASEEYGFTAKSVKQTYVVKRGEDLGAIAYRFNCSTADIISWNKLRSGKLVPGKKLTIVTFVEADVADMNNSGADIEENTLHPVEIRKPSKQSEESQIVSSQSATTKNKSKATSITAKAESKYIIHIVQPGDTLFSIAKRYDYANVAKLKEVNKISKTRLLKIGSKIKVPVQG